MATSSDTNIVSSQNGYPSDTKTLPIKPRTIVICDKSVTDRGKNLLLFSLVIVFLQNLYVNAA